MKKTLLFYFVLLAFHLSFAQVTLGPSPYTQDFNSITSSLPTGFTVRTGATAATLGNTQTYSGTAVAWSNTTGAFKNFASATGLTSAATSTDQNASSNRSLGMRQTGSLGDPGAAFVLQLTNTSGLSNFKLNFNLQSLDVTSPRITTWRVDYGFGIAPTTFTAATTTGTLTTGGTTFTNNIITVDFGNALDNKPENVWIRIVAITASTGSGNRPSSAIDDFSLTYTSGTSATPIFSVNPTAIAFGNQAVGTSSNVESYLLTYSNLDGSDVTVTTALPFAISKNVAGPFSNSLTFIAAELVGTSINIYSQFSPTVTGAANNTVTHTGGGVSGSTTVLFTGTGVNLNPIASSDSFSGTFGDLINGNVSSNDSDPQTLPLTFAKLTDPQSGTLVFNTDGTFSYQSIAGSAAVQSFTYRATNTLGLSADATATLTLAEKSSLFISQYYEGISVNKWIELTNPTGTAINTASPQLKLALYSISGDAGNIVISGSPTQVVNLNIIIPAKSSVLIGNTGNGTEVPYLTAASAQQTNNSVVNFNGNDGVALLDASNNIQDAFGTGVNAKDASYVRNQDAVTPSATFNVSEWTRVTIATVQNAADLDDPDRLGVHVQPELPPCVSPINQPSSLIFSSIGTKTITLNFTTSSDASEYLIIRSLNASLSANPTDGTIYNTGNNIGDGIVAGRIGGNSFVDNNLASGTTFYYFIYALNSISCDGGPLYQIINPLSGSAATDPLPVCVTPTLQPTNFHINFANYNVIQGKFDTANGADEFLVVMSVDSILSNQPINQTNYTVGDSIGGGIVIKKGVQASFSRSALAQNTDYYFFIYSLNSNCSNGPLYLTTEPLTGKQRTGILDNNTLNFYFGNLHAHSSYSDGNKDDTSKKPEDDYAFAKNSRNMDFLGISEHNHTQAGMRLANWAPGIQAAKDATTPEFVAMHGMEWGVISGGGHVIVYGIDSLIGWEPGEHQIYVPKNTYTGSTGLFNIINRHGLNAIATLAHPNTTDYNNVAANYNALADSAIVGSALESGPAFSTNLTYSDPASSMSYLNYYNRMLSMGYHLGATVDHDNHNLTFGRHTRARTVVLAPALTENDLLDAMKKMRFYASEDSAARIKYTINNQPIGSVFAGNGKPSISVTGSTTSPITNITIMHGIPGSGISPTSLISSAAGTLSFSDSTITHLTTGYYYADIVEADGSRIITSPIWYTRNDSIKSEQTITFNALASRTYGDADFDPSATSTNSSIPIVYSSSDTNIATIIDGHVHIKNAGSVTITANQAGNSLFKPAFAKTQTLVIEPRAITVYAEAKQKVFGTPDPELTFVAPWTLLNEDAFTGSLTRDAGEDAGLYVIRQGTLALNSNYILTVDTALFTINKATATIALSNLSQLYDGLAKTVTTTTSPTGLKDVTITYDGLSTAPSAVGSYAVVASLNNINYTASPATGTLTITQPVVVNVQYRNADSQLTNSEGKPYLKIVNTGTVAVPYSQLTARYWITPENFTGNMGTWIDYAQMGNSKVMIKYVSLGAPHVKALGYIEYSFSASAGSLAANGNSGEIQSRYANSDWSAFNEANDYSIGTNTSYADHNLITLYKNGVLIWGTEPAAETPIVSLKAFSEGKSTGSNTISTFVDLRNDGNVSVDYKDISARYWFTSDGSSPLNFWIDYAKIGNSAIHGSFTSVSPVRTDANTYLELKVTPAASTFYPLSATGNIQCRVSKNDWSNFNQLNDYSYKSGSMSENVRITLYYKGQLVYGTEPSSINTSARTTSDATVSEEDIDIADAKELVSIHPNPSSGNFVLQMNGGWSGSFSATLLNSTGQIIDNYTGVKAGEFRKEYDLKLAQGMYIMKLSRNDHVEHVKIIIH